ncbi:hypothetical protein J2X56_002587 [Herbaspirillum sp. 1173]|nr:hypothetical protein [Herbaspirillum sp. 1173]
MGGSAAIALSLPGMRTALARAVRGGITRNVCPSLQWVFVILSEDE